MEFFMRRLTMATFALTILAPSASAADLEANKQLYRNFVASLHVFGQPSRSLPRERHSTQPSPDILPATKAGDSGRREHHIVSHQIWAASQWLDAVNAATKAWKEMRAMRGQPKLVQAAGNALSLASSAIIAVAALR
jgi:hypothetical protein